MLRYLSVQQGAKMMCGLWCERDCTVCYRSM